MHAELIERQGTVVSVQQGVMTVRIQPEAACGACGQRGRCSPERLVDVPAITAARPGEAVTLGIDGGELARTALCAYLLPSLGTLGGALAGEALAATGGGVAGAALGLIAALALSRWIAARYLHPEPIPLRCSGAPTHIPTFNTGDS